MERFNVEDISTISYTLPTGKIGLLPLTSEAPTGWDPVSPVGDWNYIVPYEHSKFGDELPPLSPSQKTAEKKTKHQTEEVISAVSEVEVPYEILDEIPTSDDWDALLLEWEAAAEKEKVAVPRKVPRKDQQRALLPLLRYATPPPVSVQFPPPAPTPQPYHNAPFQHQYHGPVPNFACSCGKIYTDRRGVVAHWMIFLDHRMVL
ncbi:hypothetical protein IFR05_010059 [Cadophora sp. M221]|nr:hypothetical protein IFR05_010059 [Cadophora sp. M221]